MDVKTIIRELGGPTLVAKRMKSRGGKGHISVAAVSKWRRIPADRVIEIASMSAGLYSPADLRPDVFFDSDQREAA